MNPENTVLCEGEIIDIDASVILENVIILQSDNEVNSLEEFNRSSAICLPEVEILDLEFQENSLKENSDQIINEIEQTKKTRKRKANPDNWQRNIRHKQYQSGQSYKNSRGKIVPAKIIASTKDCLTHCRFNCEKKITKTEREELFKAFYSMNQQEKADYILKMTTRTETIRKTKKSAESRRTYSFGFFVDINGNRVQVCKPYWLGTFAISQKPVYNAHKSKNIITGVAKKMEGG